MNRKPRGSILKLFMFLLLAALTACSSLVNAPGGQEKPQTQPTAIIPNTAGNPSVTAKDQEYDGSTVVVADAFSQGPGWMVIHNQVDGSLGPAIGETQINSGDNKNIVVKIDTTQATAVMYAMLHQDAGTVGKYEYPGPDVPVMLNGEMLSPAFNATVHSASSNITPSITVADQPVTNGKVIIASAASSGPGWIAIHVQGTDGNPGSEIGYTAVKPGTSQNIVVNIDASKATSSMFAMLHIDAGVIGKYEFPGPDAPQQANGQMVAPAFNTSVSAAAPTPTLAAGNMVMETPYAGSTSPLVKASDQALVGNTVMVDEVVSTGPGWIVIYTTGASGQPDQPIGHAEVRAGDNQMVTVQVDPTKAQGTLYAQLHIDKGTIGAFEYPGADEAVMVGVQMIASTFKITSGQSVVGSATPVGLATPAILQPSISVSDQEVKDGTVTFAQVISNGNWWLVIHRQNPNGAMGEYVGETLLKNGVNTNVVVKIDMDLTTPVLYAMLHEDHGAIGRLEFPGPDVPVMVNGQMLTPTFNVSGFGQDVTINIQKLSDTVSYLTDGQGVSLYISLADAPGKSNCTAACLTVWKPLLVSGKIIPGGGVAVGNLGIITLPDGTRQVTYLGVPLYTYTKDIGPGDTNGHGVDGGWFLVAP